MPSAPRSALVRWFQSDTHTRWGAGPEQFDPTFTRRLHGQMGRLFGDGRYFELETRGWDNLPARNVLLVSNHSGGTTLLDAFGLWYAWHRHHDFGRPAHGLGHEMIFASDRTGSVCSKLGGVRACRELGAQVLTQWGRDLIVMPGGDMDVWRPWKDRYKVRFAGRRGYARLAMRTGVPIVPIAHAGMQSSMMVLTDGSRFARAVGIPRIARASIFPVSLSLPWGLQIGPWPHLPPPTRLRYRIGKPLHPPKICGPGETPPAHLVEEFDRQVQASIQEMLDELRETSHTRQVVADCKQHLARWLEERFQETPGSPMRPPAPVVVAPAVDVTGKAA
ncbi:MAG: 1-acyl-sn-glycerol-3-phosphate acyltransferase [Myxococcota bacterium]